MTNTSTGTGLQLRSTVTKGGIASPINMGLR